MMYCSISPFLNIAQYDHYININKIEICSSELSEIDVSNEMKHKIKVIIRILINTIREEVIHI